MLVVTGVVVYVMLVLVVCDIQRDVEETGEACA